MGIQERELYIVSEFSQFEQWEDKYSRLIELGREVSKIDDAKKTEENLIKGCQSRVWLNTELRDGKIFFQTDSDAVITKGIAALLIFVFDGSTADEILNFEPTFIDKIGLKEHLSPTRSNGLTSMLKQIKLYALAYKMSAL
jgi:cysteine desulfuration protein SufE